MSVELLVRDVIDAELVAAAVIIFVLLTSSARRVRRGPVRERVRDAVQRMVMAQLGGAAWDANDAALVRSANRRDVTRAIADFAPSLGGADRRLLASIAAAADLIEYANQNIASGRWWVRLESARLLTMFGASEAQVRVMLADSHPRVRAQGAIAAAAWPFPDVADALLALLHDDEELCRFAAKQAFIQLGPAALSVVVGALRPDRPRRGVDVLLELAASMATPDMCDVALHYSESPDVATRTAATRVLAAVGGSAAADRLRELLRDDAAPIRGIAAHALGVLGEWRASSALADRLDDDAYEVRIVAAAALQRLGAPGTLVLRRAAARGTPRASAIAQQTLDVVERLSMKVSTA